MAFISEDDLEQMSLEWFHEIGYTFIHGPLLAPDGETPERDDFPQVVLAALQKQQQEEGANLDQQIAENLRRIGYGF